MSSRGCRPLVACLGCLVAVGVPAPAHAGHPGEPPEIFSSEGTLARQGVPAAPLARRAEPPLVPTPAAICGPGSQPETGIQGRVPRSDHASGRAAEGYRCNAKQVGSYQRPTVTGSVGGFKVERYVDDQGRDCAYYDTSLLFPTNILDGDAGVNVLDMSDPTKPRLTARLTSPAMLSPHESLAVSQERGVLAAVLGNPAFNVGVVDVYDIARDCRNPILKSTTPLGVFGHESGMALDGKTFYSASPATETIVALDITDLSAPRIVWSGRYESHGLSLSSNGDRAYVAGVGSGLIVLDTSAVQAREPDPQVREVARLQWGSMSIPQNAIPVTIKGNEYVVEIDEFGAQSEVGAGRIISIEDETAPKVVSNLRLAVHQPENFSAQADDPQANVPLQGYAGHYCNVPKRKDPGIVACSMILSGLRVFDIRNPRQPKEIAYYNAPIKPRQTPGFEASNWAMSSPSFVPERGEIWYSDGFQGFFAVELTNDVWPFKRCRGEEATITVTKRKTLGTSGDDVIIGSHGPDRIRTRGGNDLVCGHKGNDRIAGGAGNDRLFGGDGRDRLGGGAGNDRIGGGHGGDVLRGGPGRDRITGGLGRDRKYR